MHITMVKKQLASGDPCEKCAQTEEMLRRRGLWEKIDEVVWAIEGEADSPGNQLARRHGIEVAPFFIVRAEDEAETVFTSPLRMIREHFPQAPKKATATAPSSAAADLAAAAKRLADAPPQEILRWGLERYGDRCAIGFRGGLDIVLIDMATRLGLPFRVFALDTGRLHQTTCEFLDDVRRRYGVEIEVALPDAEELVELLERKGPNSFLKDGRGECCGIRKLKPLQRTLSQLEAWITGEHAGRQRDIATPAPVVLEQPEVHGSNGALVRLDPLARWSASQVDTYVRERDVPQNPLFERGFASIDCAPCMQPPIAEPDAIVAQESGSGI